jgi:predicted nucleic acid-binding protein
MRLKVLDASALVELLLQTARGGAVGRHLADERVAGPDLLFVEVASALARRQRAGLLDPQDADDAIMLLETIPIGVISAKGLTTRVWDLRDRLRLADAYYVACAEFMNAPIVTCDGRLSRAPLPGVSIIYVQ